MISIGIDPGLSGAIAFLGADGSFEHASLHKARLLYPLADLRLAKHDGRAEALLIARYALTRSMQVAA